MMKGRYSILVCLLVLWAITPVLAGTNQLSSAGINDRFAIVFANDVSEADQLATAKASNLEVLRVFRPINTLIVRHRSGFSMMMTESSIQYDPKVQFIAHDYYRRWIDIAPSPEEQAASIDNLISQPRKLLPPPVSMFPPDAILDPLDEPSDSEVQWGVERVNAPAAWASNQGAGVKVAIVDTGIDPNHPELKDKIRGGHNAIDEKQPWADDHFHGTHVAGIVAATLDGKGVVGVAPKAELYAVKVLTKEGSGSMFGIIGGLMWCIENNIDVINMSLGAEQGNALFKYAIDAVRDAGVVMVAAAGNNSKAVNFPAAYDGAIAVSALDKDDTIAYFSSRGPEINFIAPGVKILSSVTGGGFEAYSGTSMACPHVAGLAALAVAQGARGIQGVLGVLNGAAEKIPGLSASEQGMGVVNAGKLGSLNNELISRF
ncbi:S8 family peptidase [Elusimicrobiota bacterium]